MPARYSLERFGLSTGGGKGLGYTLDLANVTAKHFGVPVSRVRDHINQLLKEGLLYSDTKFYFVNADKLSKVLGTTWHELRQYKITNSVAAFLKRVL